MLSKSKIQILSTYENTSSLEMVCDSDCSARVFGEDIRSQSIRDIVCDFKYL